MFKTLKKCRLTYGGFKPRTILVLEDRAIHNATKNIFNTNPFLSGHIMNLKRDVSKSDNWKYCFLIQNKSELQFLYVNVISYK